MEGRNVRKRVLMFSAGMDSLILKHLYNFKDEECLFIDMGTKENEVEKKYIEQFFPAVNLMYLPIYKFELPNYIIPFRNVFQALSGANFGNTIYFAFTAGDTTKDKDFVFKAQVESLLNYFSLDENKVKVPGPFSIEMPYKQQTKAELVEAFFKQQGKVEDLLSKSCSCYEGKVLPCGKCRSCLRKYCALILNGIDCRDFFLEWPRQFLAEFLQESIEKGRTTEINDIKEAIAYVGISSNL